MTARVYLCGPMAGLAFEDAEGWRKVAAAMFAPGIRAVSPMRGKESLRGEVLTQHPYTEMLNAASEAVTTRDRMDSTEANCLLVNLLGAEKVSVGTMIELGWADAARVPVVIVAEEQGNVHDHLIVRGIAGWWVQTLEDAVKIINSMLAPYVEEAEVPRPLMIQPGLECPEGGLMPG